MSRKLKTKYTILIVFSIFIILLGCVVYALNEVAEATISEHNAKVNAVELTDTGNAANLTSIDPETEYRIQLNISDNNSLDDISTVKVVLHWSNTSDYIPPANATRSYYTFTWTESTSASTGTWSDAPAGRYLDPSGSSTSPTNTSAVSSYWFDLYFQINGSSMPSGATNNWVINVTVIDDEGGAQHDDTTVTFDVNKYNSFSANQSTINYGTVAPGAKLGTDVIAFTTHSNTQVNVTVAGANLTNSSYTGSDGAGGEASDWKIFATDCWMNSTTASGEGNVSFDETAQLIFDSFGITACTLDSTGKVTAYNDNAPLNVAFGGTTSSIIKDLIYRGTYVVTGSQAITPP